MFSGRGVYAFSVSSLCTIDDADAAFHGSSRFTSNFKKKQTKKNNNNNKAGDSVSYHFYLLNCVDEHTGGFTRRPRVQHRPRDLIYTMIFIKCGSAILNDSNN